MTTNVIEWDVDHFMETSHFFAGELQLWVVRAVLAHNVPDVRHVARVLEHYHLNSLREGLGRTLFLFLFLVLGEGLG